MDCTGEIAKLENRKIHELAEFRLGLIVGLTGIVMLFLHQASAGFAALFLSAFTVLGSVCQHYDKLLALYRRRVRDLEFRLADLNAREPKQ